MYRSLYFKFILVFVVFMIIVMTVVGTILLNSVFSFYTNDFLSQMDQIFEGELTTELTRALDDEHFAEEQKGILAAYSSSLGIDDYRNYYVLDEDGNILSGSSLSNTVLRKTANMVAAMAGRKGNGSQGDGNATDYAVSLTNGERRCIIYIQDTQEEMHDLCWQLITIVLQAVLLGIVIAIILSFFLAKAIASPIQNLTEGALMIASGNMEHEIEVRSRDEIGTLTNSFNHMGRVLKHTLEEVSGERQKLETVFSYLKDAVIAFADDGKVLNINKSAIELFGENYSEDFTLDRMLSLLDVAYAGSYVRALTADSSYVLRDVEYHNRVMDINFGFLRYMENNTMHNGAITVMHDITSRYELDKAQREFVANVSHELRTPLTGIKGASETILLNPDMPREFRENFLNITITESDRMLHIINDLLTLSRFDNNRIRWSVTTFDLAQSMRRVCEILQTEAIAHGHSLTYECDSNLPLITGDRERLEQVIINIASNAVKYTPENGRIEMRAACYGDDRVRITVRDNGIGIPSEDIPHLFERFYRVEKSRTSETGGTGLGLSIAKEIIDAHGGRINVQSKVGRGTLFTIILPIVCAIENEEQ